MIKLHVLVVKYMWETAHRLSEIHQESISICDLISNQGRGGKNGCWKSQEELALLHLIFGTTYKCLLQITWVQTFLLVCSVLNIYTRHGPIASAQNSTFKNAGKVGRHTFHLHYSLFIIKRDELSFSSIQISHCLVPFRSHPQVKKISTKGVNETSIADVGTSLGRKDCWRIKVKFAKR